MRLRPEDDDHEPEGLGLMAKFKRERPEARTKAIHVRVSEADARALASIAEANGWTVADLIREALDDWLERRKGRKSR